MIFQKINKDHVIGAAVGVGVCAVGYYAYKKNQNQVDNFLRQQGINVSSTSHKDYKNMSLEDLMETKELIEYINALFLNWDDTITDIYLLGEHIYNSKD